jgi:hypothetical protein
MTATDENIKKLAIETDQFFAEKVVELKDKMHPLEASAIFMSRVMLMNRSLGMEKEFRKLAMAALSIQEPEPIITPDESE